ncbi:sugar transferase [uncultured Jannaschia sp.]|uniref:sugar transferase n=1 Tax=uncultured Jannaschia sp. TaxID=293347 RepID=UPI00261F37E4|nr:sugar transferase [uncultured Jannaschia sp.]
MDSDIELHCTAEGGLTTGEATTGDVRVVPVITVPTDLEQVCRDFYRTRGKRMLDVVGAAVLLVALLPLMIVLGCLIALDGGVPIYRHTRIGRHGRSFRCLKLRSMRVNADAQLVKLLRTDPRAARLWARDQKLENDPRVTPIGLFLRKTSMDELPQLVNVLRGEMSLVGPRPVTAEELDRYGALKGLYYSVRPGMTGAWQVRGRNRIDYADRVMLDAAYVDNLSFWDDIGILLMTTFVMVKADGA